MTADAKRYPKTSERVTAVFDNLLRFINLRYVSVPCTSKYCNKLKTSIAEICHINDIREPMYFRRIMHPSKNKSRMPYAVKITSKKSEPNSPNSVSQIPRSYPMDHAPTTRLPSPLYPTKENYFLRAAVKLLHSTSMNELVEASKQLPNNTPNSKGGIQGLSRKTLPHQETQTLMRIVTKVMLKTNDKPAFAKTNVIVLDNLLRIIHLVNITQSAQAAKLAQQVESSITKLCEKHAVATPRHLSTYRHSPEHHGTMTYSQPL